VFVNGSFAEEVIWDKPLGSQKRKVIFGFFNKKYGDCEIKELAIHEIIHALKIMNLLARDVRRTK